MGPDADELTPGAQDLTPLSVEGTRRLERIGIHWADIADRRDQRIACLPNIRCDGVKPGLGAAPQMADCPGSRLSEERKSTVCVDKPVDKEA